MIKVILSGGLGNQMFQYAAGKALSLSKNTDLNIDLQVLEKKTKATPRNYELRVFRATPKISSSISDRFIIKYFNFLNKSSKNISSIFRIFRDEKAQFFDTRFTNLSDKSILYGYFQNENYFLNNSEQLRTDFTFKEVLIDKNKEIQEIINTHNSISLHIRRGDYMNNDSNLKLLDIGYYEKAIRFATTQIKEPYFFIFSDDIDWVKKNLHLDFNHIFVDWNNGKNSYIDMQLMSLCKHNIIANSSFSWWSAWLNSNPQKLVIAPSDWYKEENNFYPDGFIPEGWIII